MGAPLQLGFDNRWQQDLIERSAAYGRGNHAAEIRFSVAAIQRPGIARSPVARYLGSRLRLQTTNCRRAIRGAMA